MHFNENSSTLLPTAFVIMCLTMIASHFFEARAQGPKGEIISHNPVVNHSVQKTGSPAARQFELELQRGNEWMDRANFKNQAPLGYVEAIQHYRAAIRLNPKDPRAHYGVAEAILARSAWNDGPAGQIDEATRECREAIRLKPNDSDAYLLFGKLLSGDEAVEAFKQAIKLNPRNAEAHFRLGLQYGVLIKTIPDAIVEYKRASEIDPQAISPHSHLGDCYFGQEQYEAAVAEYRRALQGKYEYDGDEDSKGEDALYDSIGMSYYMEKKYAEAIEPFRRALEFSKDSNYATNLGNAYLGHQDYGAAIDSYQTAIKLESANAEAHYGLGLAYLQTSNKQSAMEQYEELKQLKPDYAGKLLSEINKQ